MPVETKEFPKATLKRFVNLAKSGKLSYNEVNKAMFHSLGMRVMRAIAKKLNLAPGTFDVRWNEAGIACSGEVMLHAEHLFIEFSEYCLGDVFMYRWCRDRKDSCGGANQWMMWDALLELDRAVEHFAFTMAGSDKNKDVNVTQFLRSHNA